MSQFIRLLLITAIVISVSGCFAGDGNRETIENRSANDPSTDNPTLPPVDTSCEINESIPATTGATPASLLDFSHWTLTVPVDETGGTTGTARTVENEELLGGYSSEWFYGSSGNGVTFVAPVTGAVTPNARYVRTELREVIDPFNNSLNWFTSERSQLRATVAVHRTPRGNNRLAIGKIVGYNGVDVRIGYLTHLIFEEDKPTCSASLFVVVQDSPFTGESSGTRINLMRGLKLNEPFSFSILVENKTLIVSSGPRSVTVPISSNWDGFGVYFKAGAGLSATGSDASDVGSVSFYELQTAHRAF